jgi:N-formylglutamate deformylase
MSLVPYTIFRRGHSPIAAAAVHDGHDVRPSIRRRLAITDAARLREEDPFTGELTQIAKTQVLALRSRFEVDLNRPRDEAVYRTPAEAWGTDVWARLPDERVIRASLREYDEFYSNIGALLRQMVAEHGRVVIYDLHTYNHRRGGPDSRPAPADENPEVNVGTGTMDRTFWSPVVERFIRELRAFDFHGRHLDVRENVKFRGGYFGRWIHQHFPRQVCAIAIEFKKFFMDEWSGDADLSEVERIFEALGSTLPGVEEELARL